MSAGINQAMQTLSNVGNTFVDSYRKGAQTRLANEKNTREQRKADFTKIKEIRNELMAVASINPDLLSKQVEAYKNNPEIKAVLERMGASDFNAIYNEESGLSLIQKVSREGKRKQVQNQYSSLSPEEIDKMVALMPDNLYVVLSDKGWSIETFGKDQLDRRKTEADIDLTEAQTRKNIASLTGKSDFKTTKSLREEYSKSKNVAAQRSMVSSITRMAEAWTNYQENPKAKKSLGFLDQALLVTFQKMLDEDSVVRESEYLRSQQGQSLVNKYRAKIDKIKRGGSGITDSEREELMSVALDLLQGQQNSINETNQFYTDEATRFGIDPVSLNLATYPERLRKENLFIGSQTNFSSVEAAERANLPVGTKVIINGRPAVIE